MNIFLDVHAANDASPEHLHVVASIPSRSDYSHKMLFHALYPFHPAISNMDRSITTIHHEVLHEFFIHHDVLFQIFIHHDLLVTLQVFQLLSSVRIFGLLVESSLLESIETYPILNQFIQFTSLETSGIFSSIPLQHFSDATIPSSILLEEGTMQKCVRDLPLDITSAQVRTPSRVGVSVRKILTYLELLAQIVLSSSNRSIVLHLLLLILFC